MLSTTAQYALRAMVALAEAGSDRALLGREISESSEVPPNYLSKILLDLNRAGMVTAMRGTGGGYRLQRPASEITLVEIVDIFDQSRSRPACMLFGNRECSEETACTAHEGWRAVRNNYLDFLRVTTLTEISSLGKAAKSAAKKRRTSARARR